MKKAVCLLSGGLDSVTALYVAQKEGYSVTALTLSYGQLHDREIESAKSVTARLSVPHYIVPLSMPWGGSSLLDKSMTMPTGRDEKEMEQSIPNTYVPARNSVFLALAVSCAEAAGAEAVFIGANALDYSGYPDCRPDFFEAFEKVIQKGTKAGDEGRKIQIKAPLLKLSKKEIIRLAKTLNVPLEMTWSCYKGGAKPCGECDSCRLRAKGFREAGVEDPLIHEASAHR